MASCWRRGGRIRATRSWRDSDRQADGLGQTQAAIWLAGHIRQVPIERSIHGGASATDDVPPPGIPVDVLELEAGQALTHGAYVGGFHRHVVRVAVHEGHVPAVEHR